MAGIYSTAKIIHPEGLVIANREKFHIGDFCLVTVPRLEIGECSQINAGSKILGRETVKIGDHTVIAYDCLLLTSSDVPTPEGFHDDYTDEKLRHVVSRPITIGNMCFIGSKTVIMPGVTIPDETVIPAMSYVYMHDTELRARSVYNSNQGIKKMVDDLRIRPKGEKEEPSCLQIYR